MYSLLGGIFLGWSLGANNAANIMGTAVTSRMLRFSLAAVLASVFVIIGAVLEGTEGIKTISALTSQTLETAVICSVAAALSVTIMTFLKLPVSASQAIVGSIIGIGFMNHSLNFTGLGKILVCWIGTPLSGCIMCVILYPLLGKLLNKVNPNMFQKDMLLRIGLILAGCYGAYALGANAVAAVTAVFVGANFLTPFLAALIGSASIALGIITFGKRVMFTVGRDVVRLDAFSAFIVVLSEAVTVHICALMGVPVPLAQAVIGAVIGIGFIKGVRTIHHRALGGIFSGWIIAPAFACFLSISIYFIAHLKYVPVSFTILNQ